MRQEYGNVFPFDASPLVVGLGYCAYDLLAITETIPEFDGVQASHCPDMVVDGGGPVGTALTALARLGVRSGYIGLLGDDPEGQLLRTMFVDSGVDVDRLRTDARVGTNRCLILVEQPTGRRAILCHPRVRPEDLNLEAVDRTYIQSAQILHLDGQFLPAAVEAARWMRAAGGRVCFDGNHPRPGLDELLPYVNWLVVAESFPLQYTGLVNGELAARALLDIGPEVLVVTLGERGCQIWTAEESFRVPGFAVEVVDTTGAGDAFHGAFIYGMLQGWDLVRVATFANVLAALNCQTLGGRRGLPTLPQVEALIRRSSLA